MRLEVTALAVESTPSKGPAAALPGLPLACLVSTDLRRATPDCTTGPRSWMLPFSPARRRQAPSSAVTAQLKEIHTALPALQPTASAAVRDL